MNSQNQPPDENDTNAILTTWVEQLARALDIGAVPTDVDSVLALAGVAARAVVRPAAPVTTFLVGYAAGLAASGDVAPEDAYRRAADAALALAASRQI